MPSRLIINPDGSAVREDFSSYPVTANLLAHLRAHATQGMVFVSQDLGPIVPGTLGLRFARFIENDATVASAFRLPALNFHTTWTTTGAGCPEPTFQRAGMFVNPAELPDGTLSAPLPDCVQVWLILNTSAGSRSFSAYLIAFVRTETVREDSSGWKMCTLPVPNQHSGGGLCFGNVPSHVNFSQPAMAAQALYTVWMNSPWNNDLFHEPHIGRFRRLFNWDADGKYVPPSAQEWDLCTERAGTLSSDMLDKLTAAIFADLP